MKLATRQVSFQRKCLVFFLRYRTLEVSLQKFSKLILVDEIVITLLRPSWTMIFIWMFIVSKIEIITTLQLYFYFSAINIVWLFIRLFYYFLYQRLHTNLSVFYCKRFYYELMLTVLIAIFDSSLRLDFFSSHVKVTITSSIYIIRVPFRPTRISIYQIELICAK